MAQDQGGGSSNVRAPRVPASRRALATKARNRARLRKPPKTPRYNVKAIQSIAPIKKWRKLAPREIADTYPSLVAKRPELLRRFSERGITEDAQSMPTTKNVASPFKSPLVPLALGVTATAPGFWDMIAKNAADASGLGLEPFYNAIVPGGSHTGWGGNIGNALGLAESKADITQTYLTPLQRSFANLRAIFADTARGHDASASRFVKVDPGKYGPLGAAPAASLRSVAEQIATRFTQSVAPFSLAPINYMMNQLPGPYQNIYQTGQTKITS